MRIVIVGCGRAGAELALRMHRRGHDVTVVDQAGAAFANLHPDFRGRTVQGDVLSEQVLRAAGIEEAEGLAAVTNSDAVNAVVAHAAREVFHVPRIVVRSYAPSRESIHETFGHEAISSTTWGAQRLEEMLDDTAGGSEAALGSGEVRIWRLVVPEGGLPAEFPLAGPRHAVAAFTRGGATRVAAPGTRFEPGDVLHVAAPADALEGLLRSLAAGTEGR